MAKLYPPTINENIPAFYKENGTVEITVPFSMNRAVLKDDISGFILKIKTIQGNIQLGTKSINNGLEQIIKDKKVIFSLEENNSDDKTLIEKLRIGQFLKVQMAYLDKSNEVGYYSTVGITKYTSKPILSIQGFNKTEENKDYSINHFPTKVIGEYQLGEDKTERPYSYSFSLYNKQNNLLETSGWILYNNNVNNTSDSFNIITTLPYYFRTISEPNMSYKINFQVKTINNLKVSSPNYECIEINVEELLADDIYNADSNLEGTVKLEKLKFDLKAKNNFEEGYINLFFEINGDYLNNIYTIDDILTKSGNVKINEEELTDLKWRGPGIKWDTINKTIHQYKLYDSNNNNNNNNKGYIKLYTVKNSEEVLIVNIVINQEDQKIEYFPIKNSMSFEICRASDKDNFLKWSVLQRVTFKDSLEVINWSFKDIAIEQGVQYKYSFRQYNDNGLYSNREETESIMADFEDIFLCDNDKQIKIRFNPKISSFKTTRLESKIDTIGGKHPFIFRNGIVEYKEFPIQGLISYYLDNNEEFVKDSYKELGITFGKKLERLGNSKDLKDNVNQQIKNLSTTNLENYNIKAEREFKLKLLDWLGNGEIKLFKSPSEGNYFVRLMNISLSPEDKLNRMIHSFSCQAYEVIDYNYDNLLNLNYYSLENEAVKYIGNIENIEIKQKIIVGESRQTSELTPNIRLSIIQNSNPIKINIQRESGISPINLNFQLYSKNNMILMLRKKEQRIYKNINTYYYSKDLKNEVIFNDKALFYIPFQKNDSGEWEQEKSSQNEFLFYYLDNNDNLVSVSTLYDPIDNSNMGAMYYINDFSTNYIKEGDRIEIDTTKTSYSFAFKIYIKFYCIDIIKGDQNE